MSDLDAYQINDRYTRNEGRVFLTGVQALARLPLQQLRADREQGQNTAAFLSGYPGSPLAGLNFEIDKAKSLDPRLPIVHRPVLNEEHGATAVMGSQLAAGQPDCEYDGIVGLWYGKAPGLDRAGDALRHAVFTGTSRYGGAVAIVGDDPAAKSSTLPSSSDATLVDLHMPILYPGDVKEVLTLGMHAVALSRITGAWTALKMVAAVADGSGTVDLSKSVVHPIVPDLTINGVPYLHQPDANLLTPNNLDLERDLRTSRAELVRRYIVANELNPTTVNPPDAWVGIISSGFTYHEVIHALDTLGLKSPHEIASAGIRLLHLQLPIPFDPQNIRNFANGLEEIIVVEEKNPTAEWLVKDALYGSSHQPRVLGKFHPDGRTLMPSHGILDANTMLGGLHERLSLKIPDRLRPPKQKERMKDLLPLKVQRSPYFCSGCPHNTSTKVPDNALIGAGIGCHTMVLLMDDDRVGDIAGVTAMGNEGMQWIGMEPFVDRKHFIQNIGDGTYFHSGQLTIPSAVSAESNITFKLLYNGTIAMTGGQDPKGVLSVPDVTKVMVAQGVSKIIVTTEDPKLYGKTSFPDRVEVWDRSRVVEAQERLSEVEGVTVLIHDQSCAAQLRRHRKRGLVPQPGFRVLINHRICEACGDCGEISNCLSVQTKETILGPKTFIDQGSCNLDASCLEGDCPSFITISTKSEQSFPSDIDLPDNFEGLPAPETSPFVDSLDLRMAGIGGTGVVTTAQILATSAMLDGYEVRGLDQTGLSQKAGPVVSDMRLSKGIPRSSNLLTDASADVILAFDLLVGTSESSLKVAKSGHTVLVASDSPTPTGEMVGKPDAKLPSVRDLTERAATFTNSKENVYVSAASICEELLGDATSANIFLLGVAVQKGVIPVSSESVEQAINLNGVSVQKNLSAFRWGRVWMHDPAHVDKQVSCSSLEFSEVKLKQLPEKLETLIKSLNLSLPANELIRYLSLDLIGFQNKNCAEEFLMVVKRAQEAAKCLEDEDSIEILVETVARGLHKLIAYKDEYEVARLFLDGEIKSEMLHIEGSTGQAKWHLHPPFLRALGMKNKLKIPYAIAEPLMSVLASAKFLRGTPFDLFGYAKVRKIERELRDKYISSLDNAFEFLDQANYELVIDMAALALDVRGFEDIKLRSAESFFSHLEDVTQQISQSRN
ncbi:MAG: indolepyruvate ferredoxin oxidoreductase family protein [Acidimicrobiales bacterium]|nr:indolepyruvate ferredoxin oxidoreductase family protein [Acidimicrobiales bacterium]